MLLQGATIGGDLICDAGKFSNNGANANALDADSVGIAGSVSLRDHFAAEGNVSFKDGRVGHDFILEKIDWGDKIILDLRFAKVGSLSNEKHSWPKKGNLLLHGFVYDVIDEARPEDARIQVQWLQRQPDQFLSQPYEQLAATLRGMGLQEEAVNVMIAKNTDAGRHSQGNPWNWFWYHVFGSSSATAIGLGQLF